LKNEEGVGDIEGDAGDEENDDDNDEEGDNNDDEDDDGDADEDEFSNELRQLSKLVLLLLSSSLLKRSPKLNPRP